MRLGKKVGAIGEESAAASLRFFRMVGIKEEGGSHGVED